MENDSAEQCYIGVVDKQLWHTKPTSHIYSPMHIVTIYRNYALPQNPRKCAIFNCCVIISGS